jgi:chromosome segregation ATPase
MEIGQIEKRFREVEDSVRAIANFIKEQTEKNEDMFAELKKTIKPQKIDMEKYIDKINSSMAKTNSALQRIESMEGEIETIKDSIRETAQPDIERIQSSIDNLNERLSEIDNKLSDFATKNDLENLKNAIKGEAISDKILKELELLRSTDREQTTVHKSIEKRIQDLEKETTALKVAESAEGKVNIRDMEDRMAQLTNKLNIFVTKSDLENLKNAISEKRFMDEEQTTIHKSIEKRMQDIEKEITSLKIAGSAEEKADIRDVEDNITKLMNIIEDEKRKRASILKNVQELENEIDLLRKEKTKELIGKEIEDKFNKAIVKQLGKFAKVMDNRLPNIVTREEYISFIKDVDKRLQSIKPLDFSHLIRRIEMLENQINEINTIARDVYNRIPVIVE